MAFNQRGLVHNNCDASEASRWYCIRSDALKPVAGLELAVFEVHAQSTNRMLVVDETARRQCHS